jgi:hypothetical protein
MSDGDVDFYSSTWDRLPDSFAMQDSFTSEFNKNLKANQTIPTAINNMFPNVKAMTIPDIFLNNWTFPYELVKHGDYNYYFGRTAMLHKAATTWYNDLKHYDVIIHSRWDSAFRNTNDFNWFVEKCINNISFRSMSIDKGNVWTCDWVYGGPATEMLELYSDPNIIEKHISIFNDLYKKDPTSAYTFLIGHNIYSSYIAKMLKTIVPSDFSITLVRKHKLDFNYNEDTWQKLNKICLRTPSVLPVINGLEAKTPTIRQGCS